MTRHTRIGVIGGLVALAVTSPGWATVRDTFFSWSAFKDSFPDVAKAFWLDIKMFCVIEVAVLIVGMVIALIRTSRAAALFPVRMLAAVFVDVFRGVPVILLVYLVGFGIPALELSGLPSDPIILGGIALTLSYSAYVAEVYRAGIESVHPSQDAAARSLGLSRIQSYRHVILPQAIRRVVPPLLNDFIGLQKDTVLVSFVGVVEIFRTAQIKAAANFNFTPFLAVALVFLVVTLPLSRLTEWLVIRERRRQAGRGGAR